MEPSPEKPTSSFEETRAGVRRRQRRSPWAPSPLHTPILKHLGASMSIVEVLQCWGHFDTLEIEDEKVSKRPWMVALPAAIRRYLEISGLKDSFMNREKYRATISAAVLTELWDDAATGDVRLAQEESWVSATVSTAAVHPVVDRLLALEEGPASTEAAVLYLDVDHEDLTRFHDFDVIGVRQGDGAIALLSLKGIRLMSNQLAVDIQHISLDVVRTLRTYRKGASRRALRQGTQSHCRDAGGLQRLEDGSQPRRFSL